MKKLKAVVILVLAVGISFACSSGNKNQSEDADHHDHSMMEEGHEHAGETHEMDAEESDHMSHNQTEGSVVSSYLELKNALVETNSKLAQETAGELEAVLHSADLHSEAELAKDISITDDVEKQRALFKTLSEQIYKLASEDKVEFNTLYKQYCPMAFNDEGAFWLSSEKEIRNPYFGDKMMKCGKVEETLAKK